MRIAARVLAGIIALLFIVFGIRYMFFPDAVMATARLEAVSNLGMASVRGLIGGAFLTFGFLLVMHTVVHEQTGALRFAILFLLLSIIGRIVSLLMDGSDPDTIRNIVPATIMLIISITSLVLFQKSEQTDKMQGFTNEQQ